MITNERFFLTGRFDCIRVFYEEEATVKAGGKLWRVHKTDVDKWPSDPHAINLERDEKLDLENRDIYSVATGKYLRKLKAKELTEVVRKLIKRDVDLKDTQKRANS